MWNFSFVGKLNRNIMEGDQTCKRAVAGGSFTGGR